MSARNERLHQVRADESVCAGDGDELCQVRCTSTESEAGALGQLVCPECRIAR